MCNNHRLNAVAPPCFTASRYAPVLHRKDATARLADHDLVVEIRGPTLYYGRQLVGHGAHDHKRPNSYRNTYDGQSGAKLPTCKISEQGLCPSQLKEAPAIIVGNGSVQTRWLQPYT